LVSDATFRSVLEMEIGSLGRAMADTRSRSPVVVRILHFRMVGCFSPTGHRGQRSSARTEPDPVEPQWALTDWRAVLEDVVDGKPLLPQRPALHDAAALVGRTQQNLQHKPGSLVPRDWSRVLLATCSGFSVVLLRVLWFCGSYLLRVLWFLPAQSPVVLRFLPAQSPVVLRFYPAQSPVVLVLLRVLWFCGPYLLRVLSGEELEVRDGGVLVPPRGVGGAAQEQRGQQLRVDAALLAHDADNHLNAERGYGSSAGGRVLLGEAVLTL